MCRGGDLASDAAWINVNNELPSKDTMIQLEYSWPTREEEEADLLKRALQTLAGTPPMVEPGVSKHRPKTEV